MGNAMSLLFYMIVCSVGKKQTSRRKMVKVMLFQCAIYSEAISVMAARSELKSHGVNDTPGLQHCMTASHWISLITYIWIHKPFYGNTEFCRF
jgi:hypothetical protein